MHNQDDLKEWASMARLPLEAVIKLKDQFKAIVDFVGQLPKIDKEQSTKVNAVKLQALRQDRPDPERGISLNELGQLAPRLEADLVVTPAVFDLENDSPL